jgi:carbonic anhydrase/acetyltransferase-like protein (isoleucine patch superfamily)
MFQFIHELKNLSRRKDITKAEMARIMAQIKLPPFLFFISRQTIWIVVGSMWVGSTFLTILYFQLINSLSSDVPALIKTMLLAFSSLVFCISFVLFGAFFAMIGRAGEIEGKFPRSPSHPIYALRRFYGSAWSQIYYFKPIYSLFLSMPLFKTILFKSFGLKGNTEFTVYPDSWIRDLPLLKIGRGAYLANRCTVGTNVCMNDGSILVGRCEFGDNSLVGHLAIFGLGCKLGNRSEIGIGAALGIRVRIGDESQIAPNASLYHGAEIGNQVKVGACAFVGMKAKIADGVELKPGAFIPAGAIIANQPDAERHFSSEMDLLKIQKENLSDILQKELDGFIRPER